MRKFSTEIAVYKNDEVSRFTRDRYRVVMTRYYITGGYRKMYYHGYTLLDALLNVWRFKWQFQQRN